MFLLLMYYLPNILYNCVCYVIIIENSNRLWQARSLKSTAAVKAPVCVSICEL